MINETVAQTLLQSGMIMEAGEHIIDLTNFSTSQIIAEALEEFDLIVEGDEENEERFRQAMAAKERGKEFGDPSREKGKQNLVRVLMSGHFLIMSPNRGFSFEDKQPEDDQERKIAQGDEDVKQRVFADAPSFMKGKQKDKSTYNRAAWWDLRRSLRQMGFKPILATGLYQEKGMAAPSTEPSVIVSPLLSSGDSSPDLDLELAKRLGKRYNQDGFIYAGPESGSKVMMYSMNPDRTGYLEDFDLGSARNTSIEQIKDRLKQAGSGEGGPIGATQPIGPQDNPDRPGFARDFGKGGQALTMT